MSPWLLADTICAPGAKVNRHEPMLENEASPSLLLVAPTVMESGSDDGE